MGTSVSAGVAPGFSADESVQGPRLLIALGGLGLLGFEILYRWLGEPSGPLWLRVLVIGLCGAYLAVLQLWPAARRRAYAGAAFVATAVTAENVYRMYLVDFTFTHSMPMLVVIAGCSYAFRQYSHMALYLLGSASALTLAMLLTPTPEVSPFIYISSLWVFSLLAFIVFGSRVREHNQVQAHEQVLNGVFEGSVGGLLLLRSQGPELLLANDRARELLGDLDGTALLAVLMRNIGEHLELSEDEVLAHASAVELWQDEIPFAVGDRRFWADVWIRRVEVQGDRMILIGLNDVSERRRAMIALTRNELFLERSQRIGAIGSWDVNLDSGELTWSPEMFRIYGIEGQPQPTVAEALAMLDADAQARCQRSLDRAASHGERVDLDLETHINGEGPLWLRLAGEIVEYQEERHLLGITQDVSADKQTQLELRNAKEVAERALKVRSEFLANMSHEIRTPMNGVIGMTSLLLESELRSEQRELVETIRVSGDSLLRLINDILDFSKVDAGRLELEKLSFHLEELFAGALDPLALQAAENGVELTLEIDATVPPVLLGDVTRLRQVVINLVSNAVKFTPAGQVAVRVGGESLPGHFQLQIVVADTGIGMAEEKAQRLFEAFVQEDASTTRRYGGTGLGLTISQRLVQLMGGEIAVRSTPGAGTTFTVSVPLELAHEVRLLPPSAVPEGLRVLLLEPFSASRAVITRLLQRGQAQVLEADDAGRAGELLRSEVVDVLLADQQAFGDVRDTWRDLQPRPRLVLIAQPGTPVDADAVLSRPVRSTPLRQALAPDAQAAAAPVQSPAPRAASPAAARPVVLLAEDNRINQMVASRALERLGCSVDVVENGHGAVAAVQNRRYDLVLMDVQMPELDGLAATKAIRALTDLEQPLVIALTANAMEEDRKRCLNAGMDDFLAKPITLERLADALEALQLGPR